MSGRPSSPRVQWLIVHELLDPLWWSKHVPSKGNAASHPKGGNPQLYTYLLHEAESSKKANRFAVSEEIPRILWNSMVHYCIHKCPPPFPILSQLDPVHNPTSHFLKIHLNIILPSAPGSPQWSLSLRFPHQNPVNASPLPHTRHMPR